MDDRWIVSDYKYKRQKSLEIATEEMKRLSALRPDKKFRLYRIKQHAIPSKSELAGPAQEIEALRVALHGVIGYALTAKSESKGWLEGMAAKINEAAEILGDKDRAVVHGDYLRVRRGEA